MSELREGCVTDALGRAKPGAAGAAPAPRDGLGAHRAAVALLRSAYAAIPPGSPVRLAKRTSNLFRFGGGRPSAGLDVSAFGRVLRVDPAARTAVVGGMTTYEDLADATLRHGLMPLVVPPLKTITPGGAGTGLGLESRSLRRGTPHESVTEMEILTGDGRVVTAAAGNSHDALYRGFPNSYGTLGYALSLTIELEPAAPFVHLRHFRYENPDACMAAVAQIAQDGSLSGHRADFVDGTAFSLNEMYLTVGAFSEVAPWLSDYTRERIYYQSIRGPKEDFLTIRDYLWRWDTDWFWCSRPFGVQNPVIRRAWPRRYRRSDIYRRLVALDRRYRVSAVVNARRGRPAHEDVIQDVEIPVERGAEFLRFFAVGVGMGGVGLGAGRRRARGGGERPAASRRSDPPGRLSPRGAGRFYVSFGFGGRGARPRGAGEGYYNRHIEDQVTALGGHK